jgi:hypothetical protein
MNHTVETFRKNELLQTALQRTLAEPHMEIALGLVSELGLPRELEAPNGIDFIHFNALQNARREGYFHALTALKNLSMPITKVPTTRELMPNLEEEQD